MLSEALTLVPQYLDASDGEDADGVPVPRWTCPETGTVVYELFDPEPSLPPLVLEPGYARGAEARPGTFLALEEDAGAPEPEGGIQEAYASGIDIVNEFGSSLHREGLAEPTIMTHVRNAADFVYFPVAVEGVPLNDLHERDLRSFRLDWHPLHVEGGRTRARRMPVSLDQFFRFLCDVSPKFGSYREGRGAGSCKTRRRGIAALWRGGATQQGPMHRASNRSETSATHH